MAPLQVLQAATARWESLRTQLMTHMAGIPPETRPRLLEEVNHLTACLEELNKMATPPEPPVEPQPTSAPPALVPVDPPAPPMVEPGG